MKERESIWEGHRESQTDFTLSMKPDARPEMTTPTEMTRAETKSPILNPLCCPGTTRHSDILKCNKIKANGKGFWRFRARALPWRLGLDDVPRQKGILSILRRIVVLVMEIRDQGKKMKPIPFS